jgi:hypothetical protein
MQIFTKSSIDNSLKLQQIVRVELDHRIILTIELYSTIAGYRLKRLSDCCGKNLKTTFPKAILSYPKVQCVQCEKTVLSTENYYGARWGERSVFLGFWTQEVVNPLDAVLLQARLTDVLEGIVTSHGKLRLIEQ